jgi:hypothetical protein
VSDRKPYGSRKPPRGRAFAAAGGPTDDALTVQVVACKRCLDGWGTSNRPWCVACLDFFDRLRAMNARLAPAADRPGIRVCKSWGEQA